VLNYMSSGEAADKFFVADDKLDTIEVKILERRILGKVFENQ
jgi:hypothetical protein